MRLALLLVLALVVPARAQLCPPCPPLDDQSCYQTPRRNTLRPAVPVSIIDRFGSMTANATDFHRLCAPTDKNGTTPGAELHPGHFLGMTLKQVVETSVSAPLAITYQFGTLTGVLGKAGFLLIPAGKSLTFPAPAPPIGMRSYNCHRVEEVGGDRTGLNVHTVDQFTAPAGFNFNLDPAGPWTVCVPADVDGTDPTAPSDPRVFLCNLVNDIIEELPFNELTVFVNSSLTGQRRATITRYDDLCMPAVIQ